jgi:hypothetical protein
MRSLISLVEHTQRHLHVWHAASRQAARDIIASGITIHTYHPGFGYAFQAGDSPELDGTIVLQFSVRDDCRILDLNDGKDAGIWRRYRHSLHDRDLWQRLMRDGIDGVYSEDFYVYNPKALQFTRVYSGVLDDPLEQTNTKELDEFALGGLARCTAVTVNALLHKFNKPAITVSDVPVNQPGVLRILLAKGLTYRPLLHEVGKSLQQFGGLHHTGAWCLITQGHAMALIDGDLFDAENKGLDARQLVAVYQITVR